MLAFSLGSSLWEHRPSEPPHEGATSSRFIGVSGFKGGGLMPAAADGDPAADATPLAALGPVVVGGSGVCTGRVARGWHWGARWGCWFPGSFWGGGQTLLIHKHLDTSV